VVSFSRATSHTTAAYTGVTHTTRRISGLAALAKSHDYDCCASELGDL
jgi:hypothetical protein